MPIQQYGRLIRYRGDFTSVNLSLSLSLMRMDEIASEMCNTSTSAGSKINTVTKSVMWKKAILDIA